MIGKSQFILLKPQFNLKTLVKNYILSKWLMRLLHCHFQNQTRPWKVPRQNVMFVPVSRWVPRQSSRLPPWSRRLWYSTESTYVTRGWWGPSLVVTSPEKIDPMAASDQTTKEQNWTSAQRILLPVWQLQCERPMLTGQLDEPAPHYEEEGSSREDLHPST